MMTYCAGLIALLGLTLTGTTMGHAQSLPFSEDELYRVFRLVVDSETNARAMAQNALAPPPPRDLLPPPGQPTHGLQFVTIPHVSLTEDTLVLLSLLSEELRVRVERYRNEQRGRSPTPREQQEWEARRAELRWVLERPERDHP